MKVLLGIGVLLSVATKCLAQEVADAPIRFNKVDHPGVQATYDAPKDVTQDALEAKLKAMNLGKKHSEKGFWKYESVTWPELSAKKVDVFFDFDRHKGKTEVKMLVSSGNDNFMTSATDPETIAAMKSFLTRFNEDTKAWQQQLALAAQQKKVAEAASDLASAEREKERAARKQEKADKEKARKAKELEEQNKKLQDLQGK